jgi:4-diphosphocytidyl-2-C-methyl-D-erythritol kinase
MVVGTQTIAVRVPAKINLYLRVGEVRADGFHDLTTVYHAIGLYDDVAVTSDPTAGGITLSVTGEGSEEIPVDERNLAVRAAMELATRAVGSHSPGLTIRLRKRIPVAGGLAGGSADAAATLVACDALWRTALSPRRLSELAATLGSDVPFLLTGQTAVGEGRGELVTELPQAAASWHWVVVPAPFGLATPAVYAELDRMRAGGLARPPAPPGVPDDLRSALACEDPNALGAALHNDLEPAALSLRPELAATLAAGRRSGAIAGLVSGSGPTCVFLAEGRDAAEALAAKLTAIPGCQRAYPVVGPVAGATLVDAHTVAVGS